MKKQMSKPKPNNHLLPAPQQTNKQSKNPRSKLVFYQINFSGKGKAKDEKKGCSWE